MRFSSFSSLNSRITFFRQSLQNLLLSNLQKENSEVASEMNSNWVVPEPTLNKKFIDLFQMNVWLKHEKLVR